MLPYRPGMIVHILYPGARGRPGAIYERAAAAADTGYYEALEVPEIDDRGERASLGRLVDERGLKLVYWVSFLQMESEFSLSSPDEGSRRRAVAEILPHLSRAAECRAHTLAIVPGRDVDPALRPRALESLERSILELAEAAGPAGMGRFEMETMDREAHKKHVLGPTPEALDFIGRVRRNVPEFYLAFDTSHVRLLGEDPAESLRAAAPVTGQLHLANCVFDPTAPGYGDHHMPPGPPGFLDRAAITRLLEAGLESGFLGPARPVVSVEAAGPGGEESAALEFSSRRLMEEIAAGIKGAG